MIQVTLFIEDSAIKVLVANDRRVEKWAKAPLDPGMVSDGLILEEALVADKIRELFRLQKITARTVVAGLSGFGSVYRLISLPELPPELLPEAVQQEATRVVPVPINQMYVSWQALPAAAGETLVYLAASPRNNTDALLRTLSKAGLRAELADLAPLALCRNVDAPQAIMVDASSSSLDIAIMVERVPRVIRSLSIPGETKDMSERITSVVEELSRTIAFYNSTHRDKPLTTSVPVFVSGDLAHDPDIWQSLSGEENHPVSALPSPMQAIEGFDPSQFMVNTGLALKRLSLEKEAANFSIVNFNALPHVEKPKKKLSPISVLLPIIIVLGIGGILYMYNIGRSAQSRNDLLRSQVEIVQSQIPGQQAANANLREQIEEIEPQIGPIEAEADAFNTTFTALGRERAQIDRDLTHIANLTPEDVALVYAMNDEIIGYAEPLTEAIIAYNVDIPAKVIGMSRNIEAVFQYARDLRASGGFSDVIISSIERYEDGTVKGYNFEFSIIY
jgi:type IV pilus assembly protein PilM